MSPDFVPMAALILSIFGAVWSLAWWLSGKFSEANKQFLHRIDSVEKSIVDKLEYHERHDDTRFSGLHNDIWELRVQNAANTARSNAMKRSKAKSEEAN